MNTDGTLSDFHDGLREDDATALIGAKPVAANTPSNRYARILVIDDEAEIGRAVTIGLTAAHFDVRWEATASQGIEAIGRWHPDVVVLDLSLPDMDGIAACREIRSWSPVPIVVLSVYDDVESKIAALESGADDYLTKPFSIGELTARLRVALRHAAHASGGNDVTSCFRLGDLVIDFERRKVTVRGAPVHLTPTEYAVLTYLASHVDKVVTHTELLQAVWGPQYADEVQYLRVCITQLRRKIEEQPARPRYLLTEPGVGYRLVHES